MADHTLRGGEQVLLVLSEIRQNAAYSYRPIPFLDGGPFEGGMVVQGLPVRRSWRTLSHAYRRHRAEVVVTAHHMSKARRVSLAEACRAADVECHTLKVSFELVDTTERARGLDVSREEAEQPV